MARVSCLLRTWRRAAGDCGAERRPAAALGTHAHEGCPGARQRAAKQVERLPGVAAKPRARGLPSLSFNRHTLPVHRSVAFRFDLACHGDCVRQRPLLCVRLELLQRLREQARVHTETQVLLPTIRAFCILRAWNNVFSWRGRDN